MEEEISFFFRELIKTQYTRHTKPSVNVASPLFHPKYGRKPRAKTIFFCATLLPFLSACVNVVKVDRSGLLPGAHHGGSSSSPSCPALLYNYIASFVLEKKDV